MCSLDPKQLASTLQTENEESCTTYNMPKVSWLLFRSWGGLGPLWAGGGEHFLPYADIMMIWYGLGTRELVVSRVKEFIELENPLTFMVPYNLHIRPAHI